MRLSATSLGHLMRPVALTLVLASCVGTLAGDPPPIPPVRAERIPAPPSSRVTQIWQPGHWQWDGRDYVWLDGEWVARSGHGSLWQDGYWRRQGNDHVWIAAHWL